ncbi:MAG: sulfurtransferase complex subunit TusD [Gammaproteobacteria bacterium]|nr:sulfurtransferase complex subunit TusD [Gammaproteobacteria bacterium]
MRLSLLVQGEPCTSFAPHNALAFARAAVAAGHGIGRVFFYKDAALLGSRFAADEQKLRDGWTALATEAGFELAVCISAAARRGIVEEHSLADGFTIVGLGQMIEAMEESDRLVAF